MELHFSKQQTPSSKRTNFKARNNNKFIGVRQRPSGRWVAEIKDTTQKIRMWLGTFETAEEAAHAYDEAACLLRGSNTRTNFTTVVSSDSPVSSRIRKMLNQKMHSKKSLVKSTKSARIYSNVAPTISTSTFLSTSETFLENRDPEKNDEEIYRPCIMNGSDEYELCGSSSWVYDSGFELPSFDELDTCKRNFFEEGTVISSELDRMKVERQISASLYAMNGVQEYLDAVNVTSDSFWDLPPLYKLCWS